MSTQDVAEAFTALCKSGQLDEAGDRFWADDVVSLEPQDGPMSRTEGRDQAKAKGDWWVQNNEIHAFSTEGPMVNGDQFVLRFKMDVTFKPTGERSTVDEVAVYTVREGKIVEERFFY